MAKIGINIATSSLQKEEVIVGIDLGTTNSLVAIIHPSTKQPVVLKEHSNNGSLVPSIIYFDEQGNITVGEEAGSKLITDPQRTIFSAKRLMGKTFKDIAHNALAFSYKLIEDNNEGLVKVQVGDRIYSPVDLSSFILRELKQRAEHILKTPVNKAVITVPAYFND
ncbi:MAG: Hsp70 family protein, partial [Ferruginibacter sp.]